MRQQQILCELAVDRDCGNSVQTTASSGSYDDLESVEDNGNVRQPCTLTEENLSKFISSIDNLDRSSITGSDASEPYDNYTSSSSKNNVLNIDNSDSLSIASVSSCGNFSYSDDEALSSTSCELPTSPNLYPHGIINPNYPGFQHFAHTLNDCYPCPSFSETGEYVIDRNNNAEDDEPVINVDDCNLGTYLKLYQTESDIKLYDSEPEQTAALITTGSFVGDTKQMTPPDILFEHPTTLREQQHHQPDLIKNLTDKDEKEELSIVGDLGKEIAEELGTEYNLKLFKHLQHSHSSTFKKTKDAELSTVTDKPLERKGKVIENPEMIENNNKTDKFGILEIETKLPVLDFDVIEKSLTLAREQDEKIFSRFNTSDSAPKSAPVRIRWKKGKEVQENCPFMFPRVYESSCVSEHELIPLNRDVHDEDDDELNVVDKFVRVINLKTKRLHHEEIRRRLQMGEEDTYFKNLLNKDKPGRKPSLHSRLQNGKNLQICFMNEVSDGESPSSDSETCPKLSNRSMNTRRILGQVVSSGSIGDDNDFYTYQAKLQIEARMALAQAKDMAHLQMELEKQRSQCPVTRIIQNAMRQAEVRIAETKRRLSRQILTNLSVSQLKVIVNELNYQIAKLNESLVQILMERDDMHMGQDSILVDIEDLTRYLAAKEQPRNHSNIIPSTKIITKRDEEQSLKNNNMPNKFFRLSTFSRN